MKTPRKPLRCRFGFHRYADLWRHDETMGQPAIEECLDCGKSRSVFRLLHYKDDEMHPRARQRAQ